MPPGPAKGLYSSGFTFPTWANLFLGTRLASHGYVFAAIQHYGEGAWPWHPQDDFQTIAFNRPRDISFALTELLTKSRQHGDLFTYRPHRGTCEVAVKNPASWF